jgi:hypothetical protein
MVGYQTLLNKFLRVSEPLFTNICGLSDSSEEIFAESDIPLNKLLQGKQMFDSNISANAILNL